MKTETIEYKGYKADIHTDEGPENPFEAWDCEPPLLTYYGGRHGNFTSYNGPESLREVLRMLPSDTWERGKRMEFFREFMADRFGLKEVAGEIRRQGNTFEAVADLLTAECGNEPEGWRSATEWFELVESLLKRAGIPCLYDKSIGHCQGDVTLCLVVLTPEWLKESGADASRAKEICRATIDLYSAWAWGDVYGVASIRAPGPLDEDGDEMEGEEIDDSSCWGFYGRDHEKSGLMEHIKSNVEWHIKKRAEETARLEAALCSAE